MEDAIIDASLALGWVTAAIGGARAPAPANIKEMTRLLRSNNGAKRSAGAELALRLGREGIPELHELIGHSRREVRNAVASALGEIADERSIPYLMAGMYSTSQRASVARPPVDTAAEALTHYSIETRKQVLHDLTDHIRPQQLLEILKGFPSDVAFDAVEDLQKKKLLFLDWGESPIDLFVEIDPAKAWPILRQDPQQRYAWRIGRLLPKLLPEHQLEYAREWVSTMRGSYWEWDSIVRSILEIEALEDLAPIVEELIDHVSNEYPGKDVDKEAHLKNLRERLRELSS
jgi:hypothetical protein